MDFVVKLQIIKNKEIQSIESQKTMLSMLCYLLCDVKLISGSLELNLNNFTFNLAHLQNK